MKHRTADLEGAMSAAVDALALATPTSVAAEIDTMIEHFRGTKNQEAVDKLVALRARLDGVCGDKAGAP